MAISLNKNKDSHLGTGIEMISHGRMNGFMKIMRTTPYSD
jgi:hypothetical protein